MAVVGKFIIYEEGDYFFKYILKANNGQTLIISEPYKTEKACREGISTLQKNLESLQIDFEKDKKGQYCFRLITKQGRPLAQSANYSTKNQAISASSSFKRFALTEDISLDPDESNHFKVELFKDNVEKKANGKYKITADSDGDYNYSLLANNGQVLCVSQAYKSMESCKKAIDSFKKQVYEGDFYIYTDKNGNSFFKLYNSQLRLVMTGETYKNRKAVVSAIQSILAFTENAKLV